MQHGLFSNKAKDLIVIAFSDAVWGDNYDDRTSTTSYIIYLGSTPISWKSSKKKTVVWSSTKVKYRALANVTSEVLWLTNLLKELHSKFKKQPIILCDNVGTTYLSSNPVLYIRMEHLEMDYHFVRQRVQARELKVSFVPTRDQLAYGLTKPLSR